MTVFLTSHQERTHFDHKGVEKGPVKEMEVGGLEAWIAHAAEAMMKTNSFIWYLGHPI